MKRVHRWLKSLRALLLGRKIHSAADRHAEAADRLDSALREVLKK